MDIITGLVAPCTAVGHQQPPALDGSLELALDGDGHWEGAAVLPAMWDAHCAAAGLRPRGDGPPDLEASLRRAVSHQVGHEHCQICFFVD